MRHPDDVHRRCVHRRAARAGRAGPGPVRAAPPAARMTGKHRRAARACARGAAAPHIAIFGPAHCKSPLSSPLGSSPLLPAHHKSQLRSPSASQVATPLAARLRSTAPLAARLRSTALLAARPMPGIAHGLEHLKTGSRADSSFISEFHSALC